VISDSTKVDLISPVSSVVKIQVAEVGAELYNPFGSAVAGLHS
jgi:hypothetical protein